MYFHQIKIGGKYDLSKLYRQIMYQNYGNLWKKHSKRSTSPGSADAWHLANWGKQFNSQIDKQVKYRQDSLTTLFSK